MIAKPSGVVVALVLGLVVAGGEAGLQAQEPGKTKDDALDSLIEKLAGPGDGAASKSGKAAQAPARAKATKSPAGRSPGGSKDAPGLTPTKDKTGKASAPKPSAVAPKDQAIDDLLEKLGETKDAPSHEDRPRNPAAEETKPPARPKEPGPAKLGGQDKDIDERLEELAGRKKKRPPSDEQRSGSIGEIIKR